MMMHKWEMVKLGDVVQLLNGRAYKQTELLSEGKYPVLRVGNFFSNRGWYYSNLELDENKYCNKGDLLFAWSASFGPKIWHGEKVIFHYHIWRIDLTNKIDKLYLFYLLENISESVKINGKGIAMIHTTKGEMENRLIPLPPIEIQKKIANNLDLASALVKLYQSKLAELDKLIQSVFYDMFGDPVTNEKGWKVTRLQDITSGKLSYGSGASAIAYDHNIRYIRITDINENGSLNPIAVSPSQFDSKYMLNPGDILLARSGATVGKSFMYSEKYGKCIYAGYLIKMTPNRKHVLPQYIIGYTKSNFYKNFILSNMKVVAQPNINAMQYGNLTILLPPLSLQQKFVDIVTQIEIQKEQVQKALSDAEMLYNSLMQTYFEEG